MRDAPDDEYLLDWATEHGVDVEDFTDRCFELAELPAHYDYVPYGSTNVAMQTGPTIEDVPDSVILRVAQEWWEKGWLTWVGNELREALDP